MKRIRFRGISKKTGEWCYGYFALLHYNEADSGRGEPADFREIYNIFNDEPGHRDRPFWTEVIPESVGQSTGMKDSYGTEIFEGDTLSFRGNELGVVQWHDEVGLFYMAASPNLLPLFEYTRRDKGLNLKVSGNIHERLRTAMPKEEPEAPQHETREEPEQMTLGFQ